MASLQSGLHRTRALVAIPAGDMGDPDQGLEQ